MNNYTHILLAVDFFEQDEVIFQRAKQIAELYTAKLSIIHVVDAVPIVDAGYGSSIPFNLDLTAELMNTAKEKLRQLANKIQVNQEDLFLEMGSPKAEIVRVAQENHVDLIVVGSHGRHGLALLLGSTANGVLHHATCDVLAVRLAN